jgi:hypothetical protein
MPLTGWDDPGIGYGYADAIALEILNYRNLGRSTESLWSLLSSKWNGLGMRDQPAVSSRYFATYKLALFKLAGRVLGKPVPIEVDQQIARAQAPNGGIRYAYPLDGVFTDASDDGFVYDGRLHFNGGDTFTTALVVLAYLKPVEDF